MSLNYVKNFHSGKIANANSKVSGSEETFLNFLKGIARTIYVFFSEDVTKNDHEVHSS